MNDNVQLIILLLAIADTKLTKLGTHQANKARSTSSKETITRNGSVIPWLLKTVTHHSSFPPFCQLFTKGKSKCIA